jgi:hypothetical protein
MVEWQTPNLNYLLHCRILVKLTHYALHVGLHVHIQRSVFKLQVSQVWRRCRMHRWTVRSLLSMLEWSSISLFYVRAYLYHWTQHDVMPHLAAINRSQLTSCLTWLLQKLAMNQSLLLPTRFYRITLVQTMRFRMNGNQLVPRHQVQTGNTPDRWFHFTALSVVYKLYFQYGDELLC